MTEREKRKNTIRRVQDEGYTLSDEEERNQPLHKT